MNIPALFLYLHRGLSNDPRNGVHDPADFWAFMLIMGGLFALILGLTNWRLGFWLTDKDVRALNIISGIIAILLGIIIVYNQ